MSTPNTATAPVQCPMQLPPEWITAGDREWAVQRVWTGKDAEDPRLPVEASCGNEIRGGWWDGQQLLLLNSGQDPKLRALADWAKRGTVVSHRPAKRAVVHVPDEGSYVKVVRYGRAADILTGIHRARAFKGPFLTPEVLHCGESDVKFSTVAGVGLHDAGALPQELWHSAWSDVLGAWYEAVTKPQGDIADIPLHSARQEAQLLMDWTGRVSRHIDDAASADQAARRLGERLTSLPRPRLRPAHRDLHDKQLLWSPTHTGLLDVDTACVADPALDLGNLRAHAELRQRQGIWTADQAAVVVGHVNEAASAAGVPDEALDTYELSALLRLGCVYAVRPRYLQIAAQLRRSVSKALDRRA